MTDPKAILATWQVRGDRDGIGGADGAEGIATFEAACARGWPGDFDVLCPRLKRGSVEALPVIAADDSRFAACRQSVDLDRKHVFPAGI